MLRNSWCVLLGCCFVALFSIKLNVSMYLKEVKRSKNILYKSFMRCLFRNTETNPFFLLVIQTKVLRNMVLSVKHFETL